MSLSQIFASTIALVYIYGIFEQHLMPRAGRWYPFILGAVFGAFAVINLLSRIEMAPGVIFEGRAILIALSAFIGGCQSGLVSAGIFSLARWSLGGLGVPIAIGGALMFVLLAAGLRHYWRKQRIRATHLFLLSLPILLQSYMNILLLPPEIRMMTLSRIALPLAVFIPLGILLTGLMLLWERDHISTQQALTASEQRFRAVFDNAFQFTGLLTPDGQVVQLNRSMNAFCSRGGQNAIGQPLWMLSCWFPSVAQCQQFVDQARQGRLVQAEVDVVGPDQRPHTLDISLKPLVDAQGTVVLLIFEGRDITERKTAQRQERERELERERVIALEQFVNEISHDLRTPITVLYTSIYLMTRATLLIRQRLGELLAEAPLSLHQRAGLEDISGLVEKIAQRLPILEDTIEGFKGSVQNITDMVHSESPGQYQFEETSWHKVVAQAVEVVRPFAEQNHIEITFTTVEPSPRVYVDRGRFKSVIQNLLENAVHYAPQGGQIRVSLSRTDPWAVVEVSDTGMGIAPADLPHIFDRYYRSEQSRAVRQSGSGLGLAIVKKIVETHQGRIEVDTSVGSGSTFRVYIPLHARGTGNTPAASLS